MDLPNTKIVDSRGNPLIVSAIVIYQVLNSRKAALKVTNLHYFILNQAQASMKEYVAKYPYEVMEDDPEGTLSLRGSIRKIERMIAVSVQKGVEDTGVKIHSVQFNELSYAPEISSGMLRKQAAQVTVTAKRRIVQGAIEIAHGTVERLEEKGLKMLPEEKVKLVSNLLTVICGDSDEND